MCVVINDSEMSNVSEIQKETDYGTVKLAQTSIKDPYHRIILSETGFQFVHFLRLRSRSSLYLKVISR